MIGIGVAEFYHLCTLYYFSLIVGVASTLSILITLRAYTQNYKNNKNKSNKD